MLKELGTLWHSQSTLVFKSPTEKKVTGRYENGEFIELDDTAVELCHEWGFKYDQETFDRLYNDNSSAGEEKDDEEKDNEEKDNESVEESEKKEPEKKVVTNSKSFETVSKDVEATTVTNTSIDVKSFLSSFYSDFVEVGLQDIAKKHQSEVNDLENKLYNTEQSLENTKAELNQKNKDFDELTEKYEAIKKKFDTMKSIFA